MDRTVRRSFRVSLRTLFVLITGCAVWLGFLSKQARDQRAAVRQILQLGGTVTYDFQMANRANSSLRKSAPPGWRWLRRLFGDEYFQDVAAVNFSHGKLLSNDDLIVVGKLTSLVELGLTNTGISDAGTRHLTRLRKLKSVDLSETKISSEGLRFLSGCRDLMALRLKKNKGVDDSGLRHLRGLSKIQFLDLTETSASLQGISRLRHFDCLSVSLGNTSWDDTNIEPLPDLEPLPSTSRLVGTLHLRGSRVTGKGLLKLRINLPSFGVDGDIGSFSRYINGDNIDRQWALWVSEMKYLHDQNRLKLIDLAFTAIQDKHLPALYELNQVEAIDLRGTSVSKAAVAMLRKSLPEIMICVDPDELAMP